MPPPCRPDPAGAAGKPGLTALPWSGQVDRASSSNRCRRSTVPSWLFLRIAAGYFLAPLRNRTSLPGEVAQRAGPAAGWPNAGSLPRRLARRRNARGLAGVLNQDADAGAVRREPPGADLVEGFPGRRRAVSPRRTGLYGVSDAGPPADRRRSGRSADPGFRQLTEARGPVSRSGTKANAGRRIAAKLQVLIPGLRALRDQHSAQQLAQQLAQHAALMISDMRAGTPPVRRSAWSGAEARGFEPRMGANPNRISSPFRAAKKAPGRPRLTQSAQASRVAPVRRRKLSPSGTRPVVPSSCHHAPRSRS
jgi:hypothetical protein